jgi:hypothetical protein
MIHLSVLLIVIGSLTWFFNLFFLLIMNHLGNGQHVPLSGQCGPVCFQNTGLKTITYLLGPSDDLHQLHVGHIHHPVQNLTDPAQDILLQAHW